MVAVSNKASTAICFCGDALRNEKPTKVNRFLHFRTLVIGSKCFWVQKLVADLWMCFNYSLQCRLLMALQWLFPSNRLQKWKTEREQTCGHAAVTQHKPQSYDNTQHL